MDDRNLKCPECGGRAEHDSTTLTFGRRGIDVTVQAVPARVCRTCGETFVDGPVAMQVDELADRLAENASRDMRQRLRVRSLALALA